MSPPGCPRAKAGGQSAKGPSEQLFIGLMSGTSLDGIDGVLVDFAAGPAPLRVLRPPSRRIRGRPARRAAGAESLRATTRSIAPRSPATALARGLRRGGRVAARPMPGMAPRQVTARRLPRPDRAPSAGRVRRASATRVQVNAPALLAELLRHRRGRDFRSRDVAAGGQGAPLVPAFHRALFARPGEATAVLNLGGIANLSAIGADGSTHRLRLRPGQRLAGPLVRGRHRPALRRGRRVGGVRAGRRPAARRAAGRALLRPAAAEEHRPRPVQSRSGSRLACSPRGARARLPAQDVQATLAELTARTAADAVRRHAPDAKELVVCGGGAFNADLMARLSALLAPVAVVSSADRGLPPDQVEACAFAWLARAFVRREPGNIPAVTGAAGPRVLGALYPGQRRAADVKKPPRGGFRRLRAEPAQAEKLEPQPQVVVAFGFLITNWAPCRSSL